MGKLWGMLARTFGILRTRIVTVFAQISPTHCWMRKQYIFKYYRNMITLIPVTIDDAATLLAWRNDEQTRLASHNMDEVSMADHVAWLERVLTNPDRRLFIAKDDGAPVGTVRSDFDGTCSELSWTIAPGSRGRGYGKEMVRQLIAIIGLPVVAEIKAGNTASMKIAEAVGMQLDREETGVLYYSLEAAGLISATN